MLTPEQRFFIWINFYNKIHELFLDVEDAIYTDFAPYGKNIPPDKDTPEAKELFDMLADLDAFLQRKVESTKKERSIWREQYDNMLKSFEAWELGLCPAVMLSVSQCYRTHGGAVHGDAWEHIAKLKQVQGFSKEDTLQAVAVWEANNIVEFKAS